MTARRERLLVAAAAVAAAALAVSLLPMPSGRIAAAPAAALGWVLARWLQRRPSAAAADPGLPLALDLAAAALRAGKPVDASLELAVAVAGDGVRAAAGQVAGLLRLGADAAQAWAAVPATSPLRPVVPVAVRSARSGLRTASAFERLAADLRAAGTAAAEARAHRAGVLAMIPLALCFLPAFVCLGVVPVVVGIASTAFRVLPGAP